MTHHPRTAPGSTQATPPAELHRPPGKPEPDMTGRRAPQWFHFGPWVFSIDAAEALIAAAPHERLDLDVTAWATAYGITRLDDRQPTSVNLIGPTRDAVDRDYAMTTDLTQPVILGQLAINNLPPAALLIDGVHRLYRAWREAIPRLPAHLLTVEETLRIQRDALLGPGGITPPSA